MNAALYGARLKAGRADHHLKTINAEIARVAGTDAYRIVTKHNPERTEYISRIEGLGELRDDLSAIVGDFLYNLRSALDHIAWGLVIANGNEPDPRRTMFPILDQPRPNAPYIVGDPDAAAMKVVGSVQPYASGKGNAHPLAFLDELNRIDKHRELLFTRTVIGNGTWGMPGDMPSPRLQVRVVPLQDGDVIARMFFDTPYPPHPEPDFEPGFDLAVRLDQRAGFADAIARHRLDGMLATILWNVRDWIIPKFEPFLT